MIAARVCFGAAALAGLLAAWAFATGGFRIYVLGIPVSVRGADRGVVIAVLFTAAGLYLNPPLRARLATGARAIRAVRPETVFPVVAAMAAAAVLCTALAMGTRAAGGADVYGYVSQAALWRAGDLRIHQPIAASVPWPNADWTFAPLGYRPARGHTIVPTYSPGLPLLMAAFLWIGGPGAEYYVVPAAGGVLVWLTYLLGARMFSGAIGLVAALAIACSPVALFMTLWSMSDVPVAVFWVAALMCACRQTVGSAAAAGVLAGVAVLIRPNLVPLAIVPLALTTWTFASGARSSPIWRFLAFSAGCAPFALFVGWLFNDLYGSPLRSGYGDAGTIYAWENMRPNAMKYTRWLWDSHGPAVFLFALSPLLVLWRTELRVVRTAFLLFIALVFAGYVTYMQFDAWWYVRFLIPALPLMFLLGADAVWQVAQRVRPAAAPAALLAFAFLAAGYGAWQAFARDVFSIGHGEQKYEEAGRHVAGTLPQNAVVYSMQHGGNVRHYSGRLTLRLDYLDPGWLDRSITHMRAAGYEPYFLLDDWEVPMFLERFKLQKTAALLQIVPPAAPCTHTTFLFRVAGSRVTRVPQIKGC